MPFKQGDNCYHLQGITTSSVKVIYEGKMWKMLEHGPTTYMTQIKPLFEELPQHTTNDTPELLQLLDELKELFEKPDQLPPHRKHDHRVPLVWLKEPNLSILDHTSIHQCRKMS